MVARTAVIGVGDMGAEIIPHLVAARHDVTAFDVDRERLAAAVTRGARAASSAAAAAEGAEVVLGLVMSSDIPTAWFGPEGLLAGLSDGAIAVMASTTTPAVAADIQARTPAHAQVIDAPMIGGVRYARTRSLLFLAGGPDEAVAKAEPVLSLLGKVRRLGDHGCGVVYKLVTNVAVMAAEAGLREALDLADLLGADYATALELMSAGPMGAVVARARDTGNPRPLRRSAEDDDILLSAVSDPATMLPISTAGRNRLWEAVDTGGEPDFTDLTSPRTARAGHRT
jgi:3-hydroxyisobutyrate dehydrogenase